VRQYGLDLFSVQHGPPEDWPEPAAFRPDYLCKRRTR
jgi:hypothetical protein